MIYKKLLSAGLSASIVLLSAGMEPYRVFAQEMTAPKVLSSPIPGSMALPVGSVRGGLRGSQARNTGEMRISGSVVAPVAGIVTLAPAQGENAVPVLAPILAAPMATPGIGAAALAAPGTEADAPQSKFEKMVSDLEAPSPLAGVERDAPGEARATAGQKDFDLRLGIAAPEELQDGLNAGVQAGVQRSGLASPGGRSGSAKGMRSRDVPAARGERAEHRSAFFGASLAAAAGGVSLAAHAALALAGKGIALVSPSILSNGPSAVLTGLALAAQAAALSAGVAGAVFVTAAVAAWASFRSAMRRGSKVTEEDFQDFVREEALSGRLDPGLAPLIKPYRKISRFDFSYGAHLNGRIYIRPELVASPALFTTVLAHELEHLKDRRERGPPARGLAGLWERLKLETKARLAERRHGRSVADFHIPVLERSLNRAQLSLRREAPYDVLVLNPTSDSLSEPKVFRQLSGGMARLDTVQTQDPAAVLKAPENLKRYKVVAVDRPVGVLPSKNSVDERKLVKVLRSLDDLYVLGTRLQGRTDAFAPGTRERRRYARLRSAAADILPGDRSGMERFEKQVRIFWKDIARDQLTGMGVTEYIGALFGALSDKGLAFLSFSASDRGVEVWEKLLRFWEPSEGGHFKVTRVDLENGGHILAARKHSAQVGLWIKPRNLAIGAEGPSHGVIPVSMERVNSSPEKARAAREMLEAAGFGDQLKKLDALGAEIRDIYGADVGRTEIYVMVPRAHTQAIKRMGALKGSPSGPLASMSVEASRQGFEPHLMDSPELQEVPPVWRSGSTGKDGEILLIGTGGDAHHEDFGGRLEVVDRVNEGPEDWIGHETVTASIALGDGQSYLGRIAGMARAAKGIVAKVFSKDSPGAADGDIKGSALIALERGVDVVNVSLGSRGGSADDLSRFLSDITLRVNSKGEPVIVVGSFGNAGPFDRTGSQPSTGVHVIAVAAAAKSLSDGVPEISFYSSVGPDIDTRYSIKRVRLKPDITAIGGDVTTEGGDPDVYKHGVTAAKAKTMPAAPSDSKDGRHTRMSGTSMASPMVAGIALLIKAALKGSGAATPFIKENLPYAVKAILMRTSRDMRVPAWFQGAGLVNAFEAYKLVLASAVKGVGSFLKRGWRRIVGPRSSLSDSAAPSEEDPWRWIADLKAVEELEDRVYASVEVGKSEPEVRFDEEGLDGTLKPAAPAPPDDTASPDARARFNEARKEVLPGFIEALKHPVWLVRRQAALALYNLKDPAASVALAETALSDPDLRVSQIAFMALGEVSSHSMDELLAKASFDVAPERAVWAAYALARRGDARGVARLEDEVLSSDKSMRFTVVWLLGHIGRRLEAPQAELVSGRARDAAERGNIRHLAVAALVNILIGRPEAISDQVILDLLDASSPENAALARTVSKFFSTSMQNKEVRERLKQGALKDAVTRFVYRHRAQIHKSGGLGEMVRLLARHLGIPLDVPTPVPHPQGLGVQGVDPALGPLDIIVRQGGPAAMDPSMLPADLLERFGAEIKGVLPVSNALWVAVPEHKLFSFSFEMRRRGLAATRSSAEYSEGGRPAITLFTPAGVSLVSLEGAVDGPSRGVSEARVMAALEKALAGYGNQLEDPVIAAVGVGGQGAVDRPLNALIDRLLLRNFGIVTGTGNEGPGVGSLPSQARSRLAVVVAAVAADNAPELYSGRGTPENPAIAWSDRAGSQDGGTAGAALNSARKLSVLAGAFATAMARQGRNLPNGWFLYLSELVKKSATPLPGSQAYEVGAGLFESEVPASKLLEAGVADPAKAQERAEDLMAKARKSVFGEAASSTVELAGRALRASASLGGSAYAFVKNGLPDPSPIPERELRQALGDGTATGSGPIRPFEFRLPGGGVFRARAAGLEGFLHGKLELEGSGLGVEQLEDYFNYLEALLKPLPWAKVMLDDLGRIRKSQASAGERNDRLNAWLLTAAKSLRGSLQGFWGREAGVYMILSRAYNRLRPGKDFLDSLDDAELDSIRERTHANTIWILDMFEIGEINRWGTGGGSPYAVKGYHVKPELGGDEGLKRLVDRAHAKGLKVVVDYIPNHTSLDSDMVARRPEGFLHVVPPQPGPGEDLGEYKKRVLSAVPRDHLGAPLYHLVETENYPEDGKRVRKHILIHHPYEGGGFPILWVDMAQIDYTHPSAREYRLAEAKEMFERFGVDGVRRDMAYFVLNRRFFEHWRGTLARERDHAQGWLAAELDRAVKGLEERQRALGGREYLDEMLDAVRSVRPDVFVFDEVYDKFSEISRSGSHAFYNKVGLYDALVSGDADRIRASMRELAFRDWQTGAAGLVNFIGTHDAGEGNPFDKFGRSIRAAALAALSVRPFLLYNGVEQGVGQKDNLLGDLSKSADREKAIPFDIPVKLDWSKADAGNRDYLSLLLAKGEEHQQLLAEGVMDVLSPEHSTPIVAWSVGSSRPGTKLIMAANFSGSRASGVFKFPAVLRAFGAFSPKANKDYVLRDFANPGPDGEPGTYRRSGADLLRDGLYIGLDGDGVHLFEVSEVSR